MLLGGDVAVQFHAGVPLGPALGTTLGTLAPIAAAASGLRLVLYETLQRHLGTLAAQQAQLERAYATVEQEVADRTVALAATNTALVDRNQALAVANQQLAAAAATTAALATAQERLRLSQDLHDHLGHQLVTLQLQLAQSRQHLPPDALTSELALYAAETLAATAYQSVRATVQTTRAAPRDLAPALAALVAGARLAGLAVDLHTIGPPAALPPSTTQELLAITQEALTNIHRHAQATSAVIRLATDDLHGLHLTIQDQGVGMRWPRPHEDTGAGLGNLHARTAALGGTICIQSTVGAGTTIRIQVPLRGGV